MLHLNAFLMGVGHHEAAWRLPDTDPFAQTDVEHFKRLARIAERGKLDSLFLADSPVLWNSIGRRPAGTKVPTTSSTYAVGPVVGRICAPAQKPRPSWSGSQSTRSAKDRSDSICQSPTSRCSHSRSASARLPCRRTRSFSVGTEGSVGVP